MRVTRILDLIVIVLLAVVLLMPRPDVTVKAALRLPPEWRERVAELQARLVAQPDAVEPAIELANIYLDGHRPDWALATVGSVLPAHGNDFRLHHVRAIAYADRFESAPAFEAASRALALCELNDASTTPGATPCSDADRGRLNLLKSTLESVAGHRHARRSGAREGKDHAAAAPDLLAEADRKAGREGPGRGTSAGRARAVV